MQKKLFFKSLFVILVLSLFLFPFTAQANELTGSNFSDPSDIVGDNFYKICYSDYFDGYNLILLVDTPNSYDPIIVDQGDTLLVQGLRIYGYDNDTWTYIQTVGQFDSLTITYSSFTDYNAGLFRTITSFVVSMFSGLFDLITNNVYLFSIIILFISCSVIFGIIGFLRLLKLKRSKKYYGKKI